MSPEAVPEVTASLADWVFRRHAALLALAGQGGDVAPLLDGCPVSADEVNRLLSVAQFGQVLNDLRQMCAGPPATSPTIEFLRSAARPASDNVVLDVGCSVGRHLWELSAQLPGRMVGLDLDLLAMLAGGRVWEAGGRPSPVWVCGSVLDLPFADVCFSHVLSAVTLSLVAIRPALAELGRVLRPGGQLLLTVEGPGFWRMAWDRARPWSVQRLQLLRWLLGNWLLRLGVDWQSNRRTRRLAGLTQFRPQTLSRLVRRAGFDIQRCEPLTSYRDTPALIGLSATRSAKKK